MQLELITPKNIESNFVQSISKGIVYYVHTGRNAWHSTWVTQYTRGCMHTTFKSAKEYSEKLRTRGTVFYISQLPCLVFRAKGIAVIVTEINSNTPLSGYSPDAATKEVPAGVTKINGALENYLINGAPLEGAAMSFIPNSRFWRQRPPPKNSVIILSSKNQSIPIEKEGSGKLLAYKSYSNGGNYYLGWRQIDSSIKRTAVLNLYLHAKSNNSKKNEIQNNAKPQDAINN